MRRLPRSNPSTLRRLLRSENVNGWALSGPGVILIATAKKYYKLGGKFKLQYMQIGRN